MSEPKFDPERGTLLLGDKRLVFHCNHYNVSLQRALEDGLGERAVTIQRDAGAEAARGMLERIFASAPSETFEQRVARAAAIFGMLGFGRADVTQLGPQGGTVRISPSHYGMGWLAKFGPSARPVDHFATGFFRGAVCAARGLAPERVTSEQTACAASAEGAATELRIRVN